MTVPYLGMNQQPIIQIVQPHWYEYISIAAIILGPILALMAQRMLDAIRDKDDRKKKLYFTLMSTRAMFNSVEHVQALNSIDVIFAKHEDIRALWGKVLRQVEVGNETVPGWTDKLIDLRTDLYQAIGRKLGYDYTTEYIKDGIYFPQNHLNAVLYQNQMLEGLAKAVQGGKLRVVVE